MPGDRAAPAFFVAPLARAGGVLKRHAATASFVALIALCVLLSTTGVFDRVEGQIHDLAVRQGMYAPDRDADHPICLVVFDDNALTRINDMLAGTATDVEGEKRWPWKWPVPRSLHAYVVSELDRLGARTIAFDISFGELTYEWEDSALREAIGAHANVLLAARLASDTGRTEGGLVSARATLDAVGAELAGHASLEEAIDEGETLSDDAESAIALLSASMGVGPEDRREVSRWLDQARAARHASKATSIGSVEGGASLLKLDGEALFPTPAVGAFSAGVGNTDMGRTAGEEDAVVRSVPLWVQDDETGIAYPMLGLAAAIQHAGAGPVEVADTRTTFGAGLDGFATARRPVPAYAQPVGGFLRIAWPNGRDWQTQFSVNGEDRRFSVLEILTIEPRRRALRRGISTLNDELGFALFVIGGPVSEQELLDAKLAFENSEDDSEDQLEACERFVALAGAVVEHASAILEGTPDLSDDVRATAQIVTQQRTKIEVLEHDLEHHREALERLAPLEGALVFIGSTATKRAIDLVPTSIDSETPGVFVHAAIAHSVLTGRTLSPAPPLIRPLLALIFGIGGLRLGKREAQWVGLMIVLVVAMVWFLVAIKVIDARLGLGPVVVPPLATLFVVWLVRSTYRALIELRARRLTEDRFKTYVSPEVVDILVSNPHLSSMEPQKRELTIMFSDIAGFTTMAERLGTQRTTDVLSEYLRAMTDVLQETGATLDKYLGDGIMAFWGAPIANPDHAQDAVRCAVTMLERLDELNERHVFAECGPAHIRIGIATGDVSVGDFGNPPERSAYTVIGDSVNLSARLESANKQLGTTIAMNGRCAELAGDAVRTRAVGSIVVVGKSTPEPIREVVGPRQIKGDQTDAWIRSSDKTQAHFLAREWAQARRGYEHLRDHFGDEKIAALHLEAIGRLEGAGDTPPHIELTEK